jgi:CrcB protein
MDRYLLVMLGAAFGGVARYVVYTAITERMLSKFPYGTVIVNLTGCFLIGLAMPFFLDSPQPRPNWRLLLVTGVLGGYTTFSSFMWEAFQASSVGDRAIALANILASVIVGFLAVWCGTLITRR